jgi:hypothetical protein
VSITEPESPPPPMARRDATVQRRGNGWLLAGLGLILVGGYFLLRTFGLLEWLTWDLVWPSILILIGLYLVIRRYR